MSKADRIYHILNGDALLEQFPSTIEGEKIVFRECLVDGPLQGEDMDALLRNRCKFLTEVYQDFSVEDYAAQIVKELDKIKDLSADAIVNLRFEDDLFCQVNMWFTCFIISNFTKARKVYLVRPKRLSYLGFGAYDHKGLEVLYAQRALVPNLESLAELWFAFQVNDVSLLKSWSNKVAVQSPFIRKAVEAQLSRIDLVDDRHPKVILENIMSEVGTEDFGQIFKLFNESAPIYGFGDLQVLRLVNEIKNKTY